MKKQDISVQNTEKIDMTENRSPRNDDHKKKILNPILFWFPAYLAAIIFASIFWNMPMFPHKWSWYVIGGLTVLLVLLYVLTKWKKIPRLLMRVINLALASALIILSCLMPIYKAKLSSVISDNEQPKENYITMNLYVMSDSYKKAHADLFSSDTNFSQKKDELSDLKQYIDSTFITTMTIDRDNQRNALNEVKNLLDKQNLNVADKNSLTDAVSALYQDEAQVLILNQDYVSMITDDQAYASFTNDTRILYTIRLKSDVSVASSDTELTTQPFSIFFAGNDQEGELSLTGRTDVDMLVTVNPVSHQIVISSFPRDSLVPNPALGNSPDKLTHLGLQGLQNTMTELSSLLDTPINNYVLINFTTYRTIIDALGGVDVVNDISFTALDDQYFPEGTLHLEGDSALMYVRERYAFTNGDFERNLHQQMVMNAIISKLTSAAMITKFDSLLTSLKGTFLTNLTDSSIYSLCQKQLDENISWNIVNYRVEGDYGTSICASSGSTPLSVVLPFSNQISFISSEIDKVEAGETITQQELPTGYGTLVSPVGGTSSYEEETVPEEGYQEQVQQPQQNQPVIEQTVTTPVPQPVTPAEPASPTEDPGQSQGPADDSTTGGNTAGDNAAADNGSQAADGAGNGAAG